MNQVGKKISWFLLIALLAYSFSLFVQARFSYADTVSSKTSADFQDLGGLSNSEKTKFDYLISHGVFNGVSSDTFGLTQQMNRAQFAKVAAIIFSLNVDSSLSTSSFTDVSADDPANGYALPYIEALKKAGLTKGVDAAGTMYNPGGTVSREELATFLIRGLSLEDKAKETTPVSDDTVSSWAQADVALALQDHLMSDQSDGKFDGISPADRETLALAAYASLVQMGKVEEPPAEPSSNEPGQYVSPQGKTMAIVGRNFHNGVQRAEEDKAIAAYMQKLGFRTTFVDNSKFTVDLLNKFDIVVYSPTVNESYIDGHKGTTEGVTVPQLFMKYAGMKPIGLVKSDDTALSNHNAAMVNILSDDTRYLTFADPDSLFAKGLSQDVLVYKEADLTINQMYVGGASASDYAPSLQLVASPKGGSSATIGAFEKGAKNLNGKSIPARVVFGFQKIGFQEQFTDDAWKILGNMAIWAIQSPNN